MPGRKRGRGDSEGDVEAEDGGKEELEDQPKEKTCGNGHKLVLVPKEVRRLEKEPWSCDGPDCKLDWGEYGGLFNDRSRYRCVHYHSKGACNYDLCGECFGESSDSGGSVRRSTRESKPSSVAKGEEWELDEPLGKKGKMDRSPKKEEQSPGRVGRRSREGRSGRNMSGGKGVVTPESPNLSTRSTRGIKKLSTTPTSPVRGSPNKRGARARKDSTPGDEEEEDNEEEPLPRSTRSKDGTRGRSMTESPRKTRAHDPSPHVDEGSPKRTRGREKRISEVAESQSDSEGETPQTTRRSSRKGERPDSPFYPSPHHVRFSPSVKTASPFGRKTRSSRRGISSYIQSLPSEDEQSEFNRQYSRDLRKRQQRKASEEDKVEAGVETEVRRSSRRSGDRGAVVMGEGRSGRRVRMDSETSGAEELSLGTRKRNLRNAQAEDQEEESDGEGDPTVTEASVRRSSRRRQRNTEGGDEADTESGVEKQDSDEEEEEDTPVVRSSRRKREPIAASSEEEETPVVRSTRRSVREVAAASSEEEEPDELGESGGRRSSRRNRAPVDRLQYKPESPPPRRGRSNQESDDEEESSDEEDDEEEEEQQPVRKVKKKVSPMKKSKYGLRENRTNTIRRYTDEFPGNDDRSNRDQGLIRRGANRGREGKGGKKKEKRRHRTGDSSSPTDSDSSDEEAFDKRKTKRMMLEREKMRPLNMDKNDVSKAIFKDRAKAGASLADVQPMEMDMGVTFESVGGLKEHVNALKEMVMFPLLYPELFQQFQIQPPRGVLFYGPPGTGKTLLARALACECSTENRKVAFFMRKGADCLSKWIGESERQLRLLFDQAYQMRPSIIFFDEIDGLAPVRSSRQDQIHSSIVSTLLALMDGLDSRGEVVLIGATNRLENIDPALRRPGRFDRELRFALPDRKTRKEIIKLHTTAWNPPITEPLLNTLGTRTIGYCGADLKGLTAEAALNALRRSYPQVYQSNKKLAINLEKVTVIKVDFDKALRKIVPSTHRVEDRVLGPLPRHIKPLLSQTLDTLVHHVKKIFPHSGMGKGAVLPRTLTHRPRLLVLAGEGRGGTTYLAPALLHFMEKLPCTKLDIPALFSNSARTPEEAVTTLIHTARRTQPGVLYIPHLNTLWDCCTETVRATLCTLLNDLQPTAPLLVLAVATTPYSMLAPELCDLFSQHYRETHWVENPGENERREYLRPLVTACSAPPPKVTPPPPPPESLPVLPAPECRALTAREEKRLKKKEDHLLRELRIFLRDIWTKVNKESKFFMFRLPVNTEEVDDYLNYVKEPMDLEKMHMKLDDGEYSSAQVSSYWSFRSMSLSFIL